MDHILKSKLEVNLVLQIVLPFAIAKRLSLFTGSSPLPIAEDIYIGLGRRPNISEAAIYAFCIQSVCV